MVVQGLWGFVFSELRIGWCRSERGCRACGLRRFAGVFVSFFFWIEADERFQSGNFTAPVQALLLVREFGNHKGDEVTNRAGQN